MENKKIDLLVKFIKQIKKIDHLDITLDTKLSTLKLDSLDIVELQMMYEDETGNETVDPKKPILKVQDLLELMP